jgi:leader peptidase (prepilin peptidase)/N-methyltransferase
MAYLLVALFGLVFGSFLNVCIVRIPKSESLVSPRSYCPRCSRPIRWFDNIPVLSYVLLRGRCRDCGQPIPLRYPLVELLTMALVMAAWSKYGPTADFAKCALLVMLLIILIFTDLMLRRIPHAVTRFGIVAGLLMSVVSPVDDRPLGWLLRRFDVSLGPTLTSVAGAVAGGAFGGGLFFVVGELFARLRHKEGLGFGDVMLMGMVGTFLGIPLTYVTILLGSLVGVVIAGILYVASPRYRHDYPWPYGTFLGVAAIFASLGGRSMLEAYLRWGTGR